MTRDEIIAAVQAATAGNLPLHLQGYVSSEGEVSDLEVVLIGHKGYVDLLRQSLDELPEIERTPDVSPEDWATAVRQLTESWTKSTTTSAGGSRRGVPLEWDSRGFYTKPGDAVTVILLHAQRLHQHFTKQAEVRGIAHRDKVTLAKALLRGRCSINRYIGQINLRPDKVRAMSVGVSQVKAA